MCVPAKIHMSSGKTWDVNVVGMFVAVGAFRDKQEPMPESYKPTKACPNPPAWPGKGISLSTRCHDLEHAHETLLHEIIHACEHDAIEAGEIPKLLPEDWVEAIGARLYRTLRKNDLYVPHASGRNQLCFEFES